MTLLLLIVVYGVTKCVESVIQTIRLDLLPVGILSLLRWSAFLGILFGLIALSQCTTISAAMGITLSSRVTRRIPFVVAVVLIIMVWALVAVSVPVYVALCVISAMFIVVYVEYEWGMGLAFVSALVGILFLTSGAAMFVGSLGEIISSRGHVNLASVLSTGLFGASVTTTGWLCTFAMSGTKFGGAIYVLGYFSQFLQDIQMHSRSGLRRAVAVLWCGWGIGVAFSSYTKWVGGASWLTPQNALDGLITLLIITVLNLLLRRFLTRPTNYNETSTD